MSLNRYKILFELCIGNLNYAKYIKNDQNVMIQKSSSFNNYEKCIGNIKNQ